MRKTIEELLAPQPEVRPRIYAYSIDDKPHAGHHGLYRTVMARE